MRKLLSLLILTGAMTVMSGCAGIYKPTDVILTAYSQDRFLPYALASGDLDVTSCGTGLGLNQLLGSFSLVNGRPAKLMIGANLLAALCSEEKAHELSLQFDQELKAGNTAKARDARIRSQRQYRITALRRFQVYKDTKTAFGEFDDKCPDLPNDTIQSEYLAGVLTSIQALLSDIKAQSSVGVPQNIARQGAEAIQCLDNRKWWGVPQAVKAVVWLSVPGSTPDGADPWAELRHAMAVGKKKGMPLAQAFYVLAAYGQSDTRKQKYGIKQVAEVYNNGKPPEDYLLLAEVAYREALYISDKMWMNAEGKRTPFLSLGSFPGEKEESGSDVNASKLLGS